MNAEAATAPISKAALWGGRVLSALPALFPLAARSKLALRWRERSNLVPESVIVLSVVLLVCTAPT
jgi:hypothetical protein